MTVLQNPVVPIVVRFSLSEGSLRVENRRTLESIRPDPREDAFGRPLPDLRTWVGYACESLDVPFYRVLREYMGRAMNNAVAREVTARLAKIADDATREHGILFVVSLETDEDRARLAQLGAGT